MNEIIKKNGIQYGIIIGFISILLPTVTYISDKPLYKNVYIGLLSFAIYWVIRIHQAKKTKTELQSQIVTLKEIFTTLLISTTIGIIISTIFNYFFYNFFATDLMHETNEFMNLKQLEIQKVFNKGGFDKRKIMELNNFSLEILLKNAVTSILISSIFNLILSAIFKTKQSNQL
jgi:hypothetical protein